MGTSSMFPSGAGGTLYADYDFMDQRRNWHKSSASGSSNNPDKDVRTRFINTGLQYMFNRQWGIHMELPYDVRRFKTTADDGDLVSFDHSALGDLRLEGMYTGFSPDMSTGLTFGIRIPTGDWKYSGFDRDVEIGSGSTDALMGAFHRGAIGNLNYFIQDSLDQPFLTQGGYRPGTENNAVLGIYAGSWTMGRTKITPMGEFINSHRSRDRGRDADSTDSGYERILLAPALELDYKKIMVFLDVGFPVYQYAHGQQLVASVFYKVSVSHKF